MALKNIFHTTSHFSYKWVRTWAFVDILMPILGAKKSQYRLINKCTIDVSEVVYFILSDTVGNW